MNDDDDVADIPHLKNATLTWTGPDGIRYQAKVAGSIKYDRTQLDVTTLDLHRHAVQELLPGLVGFTVLAFYDVTAAMRTGREPIRDQFIPRGGCEDSQQSQHSPAQSR
jgi:hypothetical protein